MASMRRLRRRLIRWERYAEKIDYRFGAAWLDKKRGYRGGLHRAEAAFAREQGVRQWGGRPEPYDPRCCLAGNDGHDGPCVIRCDACRGDGRCPECGGLDDLGCWHCEGWGMCPRGCDDGEIVLEEWFSATGGAR